MDTELTADDLKDGRPFQDARQGTHRHGLSADPWDQLRGAAGAVFGSWMNDRAIVYRRKYNIPAEWGTAVNVQAMVYGNTGENSGSGVAFTRDPATARKNSTANFSSTRRAKMSSPASARPNPSPS